MKYNTWIACIYFLLVMIALWCGSFAIAVAIWAIHERWRAMSIERERL